MTSPGEQPQLAADNELFCKNMAALWRVDPDLAVRIDEISDESRLPVEPTRSGHWTVAVPTATGTRAYLHSRYDPVSEAQKLAAAVETKGKFCFVISGFGLGYHVRALHERLHGDVVLIVTEPSLELLSTALATVDLSETLASNRVVILTDADKSRLHARLNAYNVLMMMGIQFVPHPASERAAKAFHVDLRKVITDFVAYTRTTLVTLVQNAQITCRNIASNLPAYLSTPPLDTLKDRFAGCPGVVVAAGPSLRKNIDLLHLAKGKAVIAAVQTMFRPLLERGIVPDFVTSLDFHEMSQRFFQGIDDFRGVHLVAEPKCTWHVVDHYGGPVTLLDSPFARQLLGDALAARDGLPPGATVAHLAFYLVRYLGCDPIIFVGQDLGYTGHVFYIPGVEVHRAWKSEINRFNTMETKEWERIVRNRPIQRKIKDINGRPLYTDELLFTYLEQFEKDFIGTAARLIDATEGGARMRGTDVMTLADALDRFCSRELDDARDAYRSHTGERDASRLAAGREEIAARLEEVRAVEAICDDMIKTLGELEKLTGDPARFNRRLGRVDELRAKIRQYDRAYQIINSGSQLAELQRFTADRKLTEAEASGTQRAQQQLERDLRFVQGMKQGAVDMADILTDTLARFDQTIEELGASWR
jgi:hypothetical protein